MKFKGKKVLTIDPIETEEIANIQHALCMAADNDECGDTDCTKCLYDKKDPETFLKWLNKTLE